MTSLQLCDDYTDAGARFPRPCALTACRYHLAEFYPPGESIQRMRDTCALRVADRGPHSQDQVAEITGYHRARIGQIESEALDTVAERLGETERKPAEVETARAAVLRFLRINGTMARWELAEKIGSYAYLSDTLTDMRRAGEIRQSSHGHWEINV